VSDLPSPHDWWPGEDPVTGARAPVCRGCRRPVPDCDCPAEDVAVDEHTTRARDRVDEDVDEDVAGW
jgi:hypothetical protein